jgi:DNA-binding CsgD family transcriptional regulator
MEMYQTHQVVGDVVGRDVVIAQALAALEQRRPVALFGPEGIGKSRLAAELAVQIGPQRRQRLLLRGSPETRNVPFGAMLHALDHEVGSELGPDAIRRVAERVRRSDVVVVVVDDFEQVDAASAAVVLLLAELGSPRLVLTARSDDIPLPFRRLVRDGNALAIGLEPLTDSAVHSLMERTAGQPLTAASAVRLTKLSSGIPLHVIELVRAAVAAECFDHEAGDLRLARPLPVTDLRALVGHRVNDLPQDARRALELVALGEPIEATVIVGLTSGDALSTLIERGLVGERVDDHHGRAALLFTAYPLIAELVLASTPAFRRSMHLLDLADALSQLPGRGPDTVARQLLWTQAAGREVSPDVLAATAAQVSAKRLEGFLAAIVEASADPHNAKDGARLLVSSLRDRYDEAVRLASSAYDQDPNPVNGFGLLRALMSSDAALDRAGQVIDALRQQDLDADQDAELRRVARIVHAYHRGEPDRARAVVLAEPVPEGNEPVVDVELAVVELYTGDVDVAAEQLDRFLQQPHEFRGGRQFLTAVGMLELSVARTLQGRAIDASELVDRAFPVALQSGVEASFAASLWWVKSVATALDGRLSEAESMLQSAFNASVSADSVEGAGFFADGLATVARLAGRYHTAALRGRRSSDLLTMRDVGQLNHALGEWGVSLCWLGDASGARRLLERIRDSRPRRPTGRASLVLLSTCVDAVEGKRLTQAVLDGAWEELSGLSTQTQIELVWLAAANGSTAWAARRAEELLPITQGALNRLYLDASIALEANDVDVFDEVVKRATELTVPVIGWVAASASAERCPTSAQPGRRSLAAQLQRQTEGARLFGMSLASSQLTRREQLIASLAGQGMTDAAIASQLGLSVRTVESHLSRVYRKLGVHTRRELASHATASF